MEEGLKVSKNTLVAQYDQSQLEEGASQAGQWDNSQFQQKIKVPSVDIETGCTDLWAKSSQQGIRALWLVVMW